jgi:hypothetical protein
MIACQRWRAHRDSYRPAGEPIDARRYEVARIGNDTTPKAFVLEHHYAGSYPAARFPFGLYRDGALVGVAVFSHPMNDAVLERVFPVPAIEATELGRFVLLDDVPANGETWFLARAFELLRREGLAGVLSFSDPVPRVNAEGVRIFPGHLGTIYQAHNGVYLGRGAAQTLRLLPDGRVLSRRAISKVRARHRGWRYVVELLRRYGAAEPPAGDLNAWLDRGLARLTRTVRHAGCHRYAWPLDRRLRRHLAATAAYPKTLDNLTA